MRLLLNLLLRGAFVFWMGAADAQTIRLLQSIPVYFTCLAQDPDAADAYWRSVPKAPDGPTPEETRKQMQPVIVDSAWAACARKKKWVSKDFCADILDASKSQNSRRDTARAMDRYQAEHGRLKLMYEYFEAAFPKGGEPPRNAPPCPD